MKKFFILIIIILLTLFIMCKPPIDVGDSGDTGDGGEIVYPTINLANLPSELTSDTSIDVIVYGENVVSFKYLLNDTNWNNATELLINNHIMENELSEGLNTLLVKGKSDKDVWQLEPNSYSWTIDITPSQINASNLPDSITNQTDINISVSGQDAISYQYQINNNGFSTDINMSIPIIETNIPEGNNTIEIKTKDLLGNESDVFLYTWTIDVTSPIITLNNLPNNITNQITALISVVGSDSVLYQYQLNNNGFSADTDISSNIVLNDLPEGENTIEVKSKDNAGNVSNIVSYNWTVDTTPPTIVLLGSLPKLTKETTTIITLNTTLDSVSYKYKINNGDYSDEININSSINEILSPETYTIKVIGKDLAGNWQIIPTTYTFTIYSINTIDDSLASIGTGTYTSMYVDNNDNIHISYAKNDSVLKYIKHNGTNWETSKDIAVGQLGRFGLYNSIDMGSNGYPIFSSYRGSYDPNPEQYNDLTYIYWDGYSWRSTFVDTTGNVGKYSCMKRDNLNNIYISYYDQTNYKLKVAKFNGSSWTNFIVDDLPVNGRYTSMIIDSNNNVHVSYYNGSSSMKLKYAKYDGTTWTIETDLDSSYMNGEYTRIDLDSNENVYILHYDFSNQQLKLTHKENTTWITESILENYYINRSVINDTHFGFDIDENDNFYITYYDFEQMDLKYITNKNGNWEYYTLDSTDNVGQFSSIKADSTGKIHISYYDVTNTNLKYINIPY